MSSSFETDSSILFFLSSFLLFMNSLLYCRNSLGFLSFAACFLFPNISVDLSDSANLLFLSFVSAFGSFSRLFLASV